MSIIDSFGVECRGCGEPTHNLPPLCGLCRSGEAAVPCPGCGSQIAPTSRLCVVCTVEASKRPCIYCGSEAPRTSGEMCARCIVAAAYVDDLMAEGVA